MRVEDTLLEIAKISILNKFDDSFKIDKADLLNRHTILSRKSACFVTINLNGRLRGCIGSLAAHRNLLDDVIENAQKAAFEDPRFKPLSYEEFKDCSVELSILTPAVKLEYKDTADLKAKIEVGVHGVVLQLDGKRATYLPQVWEQIPTFEEFFESLSQKAGFSKSVLENHPNIFTYTAIKIK
jgi:AmmeMemoRadiSam system protein A